MLPRPAVMLRTPPCSSDNYTHRQTDIETQTDRQRQTDKHRDRLTDTDRETDIQTERQTYRHRNSQTDKGLWCVCGCVTDLVFTSGSLQCLTTRGNTGSRVGDAPIISRVGSCH